MIKQEGRDYLLLLCVVYLFCSIKMHRLFCYCYGLINIIKKVLIFYKKTKKKNSNELVSKTKELDKFNNKKTKINVINK